VRKHETDQRKPKRRKGKTETQHSVKKKKRAKKQTKEKKTPKHNKSAETHPATQTGKKRQEKRSREQKRDGTGNVDNEKGKGAEAKSQKPQRNRPPKKEKQKPERKTGGTRDHLYLTVVRSVPLYSYLMALCFYTI